MSYCGEQCAVKYEGQARIVASLKCKAWTCEDCITYRKHRMMAEACGGCPNTFITLTSRVNHKQTPAEAAKKLSHAWRLLRLRIMRKYNRRNLPFYAVFEKTKKGWPHLHILARTGWISQRFMSVVMAELIDSPHVDIRRIDNTGRVAGYVSKYMTKDPTRFAHSKRYWRSQDYDVRPPKADRPKHKPGEGWEMWPMPATRFIENCTEWGWIVEQTGNGVWHVHPPD